MTIAANPIKAGLYSIRDYVRKGQEKEYANTVYELMTSISPKGILEECFATEIVKATWRLRRCRNVEFDLAETAELDPMIDERTSSTQKIVDRARAQSFSLLRRSISEMRKLQLTRLEGEAADKLETSKRQPKSAATNEHGVSDALATFEALADKQLCQQYREQSCSPTQGGLIATEAPATTQYGGQGLASFCKSDAPIAQTEASICKSEEPAASFCKSESDGLIATKAPATTQHGGQRGQQVIGSKTPRNAPCPCGSGLKHKKCCGNPAVTPNKQEVKPALNQAA